MDKNKLAEDWIDEKGYYNSGLRINTQHRVDLYLTDVLAEYHEYLASNGLLSNVSEILGYFDYLGDRWHITEIDGEMLNGWRLTPKGKKHTLWIHSDNVMNLVESSR